MTALDQAFIRAFSQQGTSAVVPPRPLAATKAEPQPSAVSSAAGVAPSHISDAFRNVLATLEKPPVRPASPEKTKTPPANTLANTPAQAPAMSQSESEADTGAWSADWWQTSVGMAGPLDMVEPVGLAESVAVMDSVGLAEPAAKWDGYDMTDSVGVADPVEAAIEPPRQRGDLNNQQSAINSQQSSVAPLSSFPQLPTATEPPPPQEFKPAWQVDRFTWPRVCRRLLARAAEEFDRLADAILAANSRGQKVLAIGGCCRGEGATTLLLCAARRLAERGVKLVLVDADLNRPRLAKRLGVQPQAGWNDTSAEDGTFLDHAVVEAAANNLALSAIREPESSHAETGDDWPRLASSIETLKSHYEMVLVDLGPLESIASLGDVLGRTLNGKIDAVLMVHNPRITSQARLAAVEEQLTASGVALAGLIENFVAG